MQEEILIKTTKQKERNESVDIIRGIAILFVVLGHTMTSVTLESQKSVLFNILWSLQMPLFFLISGYVTRYSKSIADIKSLFKYYVKRTMSYLLPWGVWSFFIRGVILRKNDFFNLKFLMYHMDSGYWFLFSLWTICLIYGFASYIGNKFQSHLLLSNVMHAICYGLGIVFLFGIMYFCGSSFLGTKLTLYYMPFFYMGYLFGKIQNNNRLVNGKILDVIAAVALVVYVFILSRVCIWDLDENFTDIILRAGTSVIGSIALSSLVMLKGGGSEKSFIVKTLGVCGRNSLEIYLVHYVFLSLIKISPLPVFQSWNGLLLCFVNYILTLGLTGFSIWCIDRNKYLKLALFGKR